MTVGLLKPYPNDPVTRASADSMIRAAWATERNVKLLRDPTRFDTTAQWAEVFWGINSATTRCVRRRETGHSSPDQTSTSGGRHSESTADGSERLRRTATAAMSSYAEALEATPALAMEQCRNILHRGHLIPNLDPPPVGDIGLATSWVHGLQALIDLSREILGVDETTATDDPSSLTADEDPVPEEQPA